jgi:hypothetical protein
LVVPACLLAALAPGCSGPTPRCSTVVSSVAGAQSALNSARTGSSICLKDGSYGSLNLKALKGGSGVTVQAQHPARAKIAGATLTGTGITISRFLVSGGDVTIAKGSGNISVSHNFIAGGNYYGVMVCPAQPPDRCSDVKIVGNIFYGRFNEDQIRANVYHDSGDADPYGLLIEGNEFIGNVEHGGHNDVLQTVWVGDHLYFRHHYLHDFGGEGVLIKDQGSAIDTISIENNLIVRQNKRCDPASLCSGYQLSPLQVFGPARNVSVRHNTVWGSDGGVVAMRGSGWQGPTAVADNLFYSTYSDSTQFSTARYASARNGRCSNSGFPSTGFSTTCSPAFRGASRSDWRTPSGQGVTWRVSDQWFGP